MLLFRLFYKQTQNSGGGAMVFALLPPYYPPLLSGPKAGSFVHVTGVRPDQTGNMQIVNNTENLDPNARSVHDYVLSELKRTICTGFRH